MLKKALLIKNGTVYREAGRPAGRADVLIRGGKIVAVGVKVRAPAGVEVIDATGLVVTAGLIDAHTHLGNCGEGTGPSGIDLNEASEASTPHCRAVDGINPRDPGFEDARRGGVTAVCVLPGSANVIGGTGVVVKTAGGIVDEMVVKADVGMKIAFGENPKSVHGDKRAPCTRMGNAALLREQLTKAVEYRRKRRQPASKRPDVDMRMEALVKVLDGDMPLRAHAHRADDIVTAVRIAEEFRCRIVSDHCTEGHFIATFLARHKIPCLVGPAIIGRFKVELRDKSYETAGVLAAAGCRVAITTDHPFVPVDALNISAAAAARGGLPQEQALRAITVTAAETLGLGRRMGRVAVGYDGDVVAWTDHPLSARAKAAYTIIGGEVVFQG